MKTKILWLALLLANASAYAVDTGQVTTSAPAYPTGTTAPISLDTSGNLRVTGSLAPSGTQNVTGTGTAGTPATGVVTVQGISGGTPASVKIDQTTPGTTNGVQTLTGSTTSVTGNVTVVQPTGTNLHAVLDTTSTTAVTQATASNLNAQVQGPAASNAALAGNPIRNGGSDGTNIQDMSVVVGDTGQNSTVMAGSRKEVSFTTTTAQAVASTDVSNYRYVSVHIVTQGGSSTVTFQSSNDNTNWVSTGLLTAASVGASAPVTSTVSAGVIMHGPVTGRFFRLNVTGIVSGTTAGVIEFFSTPPPIVATGGVATVFGNSASGAADSGSPVKIGCNFNTTQPTVTNAQRVDCQATNRGAQIVATGVDPLSATYAAAGTQITNSAAGASTSNVVATLAGTASKTTYISGFDVTCLAEATTAANTTITVAGLISGTETYEFTQATLQQSAKTRTFPQPVPASATNTSVVVTLVGVTGGGTCSVNAEGFQL